MVGGGAWLVFVGGVTCLVNSVNEQDLKLLNNYPQLWLCGQLSEGLCVTNTRKLKAIIGLHHLRCSGLRS